MANGTGCSPGSPWPTAGATGRTPCRGPKIAGGDLEQTLTSVHPYLRYAVNDRLAVWGLLGFGTGQVEMEMDPARPGRRTPIW